jgi:hypothetical protein
MAANAIYTQRFRPVGGGAGFPASGYSGEIIYNMDTGLLAIGYGDDGSGNSTSWKTIGRDNHSGRNLPSGGTDGQILTLASGNPTWSDAAAGITLGTNSGLNLTGGGELTVDFTVTASRAYVDAEIDALTFADIDGTASAGQIPNLSATKITSDQFDAARIPDLDAAKIATGTIDIARLPASLFAAPIVSSGAISDLTAPQQAEITGGTHVVTSDGRTWIYKGSGSKTSEASYQEQGDITPDWSVIANKPTFATVATTGAYADLTGKPTLGTIASQDADDVALTGGSLSNVTINNTVIRGGTF